MNNIAETVQALETYNQIMLVVIIVIGCYAIYEWFYGNDGNK